MKDKQKILINFGILLVLTICILSIINYVYIEEILPQKTNYQTESQYTNSAKILFLGDSHVALGINPEFISNSHNYAMPGETTIETYHKIISIASTNEAEIYILPLDIHSFSSYRTGSFQDVRLWRKHVSINTISEFSGKTRLQVFLLDQFPILGNGFDLYQLLQPQNTPIHKGWHNNSAIFSEKDVYEVAQNRIGEQFNGTYPDELNFEYFNKTIDFLKSQNKEVILIQYPITKEYYESLNSTFPQILESYEDIVEQYDINIYNYQLTYSNNATLFADSDHLNDIGAELFSKELATRLNE